MNRGWTEGPTEGRRSSWTPAASPSPQARKLGSGKQVLFVCRIDPYGFERPEDFDYAAYEEFFSTYLVILTKRAIKWSKLLKGSGGVRKSVTGERPDAGWHSSHSDKLDFSPNGQNPCGATPSVTSGLQDFPVVATTLQSLQFLGHDSPSVEASTAKPVSITPPPPVAGSFYNGTSQPQDLHQLERLKPDLQTPSLPCAQAHTSIGPLYS